MEEREIQSLIDSLELALRMWVRVDRESPDVNPSPDPVLRMELRDKAREITKEALTELEGYEIQKITELTTT